MTMLRDRRLRLALEVSVLLHLLFAWLLPMTQGVLAALLPTRPSPVAPLPQKEERPIRFELVELPNQREEAPSRPDTPLSDLSRRAHGGEGDTAVTPSSRGNTYGLRLSPGSAVPMPPANPPSAPAQQERRDQPREPTREASGAEAVLIPRPDEPEKPRPLLKGFSGLKQPSVGGAQVPDRPGGQVDLGPLSFDTQWYDWGPYAAEMIRRIRYHWRIPQIARLGVTGVTRIRFFIEKDGSVTGLQVLMDAEHPPMTFAARDAVLEASPLPPLPSDLNSEREGVTITFYYNTRPPDDGDGR